MSAPGIRSDNTRVREIGAMAPLRAALRRLSQLACCMLMLAFAWPTAHAFTIEHRATRYVGKQYQCELTATLDAPVNRVEAVLRDYPRYPMLDPRILEARILERPAENIVMLATTLRVCFGPFCRTVKRIERVAESPGALAALTDAARSDIKFGETYTALESIEGATRVTYRTSITPGFWPPPIVGRRWMLKTLERASSDLFMNVETQAREGADASPQSPPRGLKNYIDER